VSHLLTAETGRTFPEHVEAVRLKESKVLLRDRDLSVKEVASLVGWWPSELVRHFERATGMSPGRWRKREWARRRRSRRPSAKSRHHGDSDPDTRSRIRQRIAGRVNREALRAAQTGRNVRALEFFPMLSAESRTLMDLTTTVVIVAMCGVLV
jgi:AraC-like DNA-binding protein